MPLPSENDKNELYSRLKAGAESGWDFSTKHYNNYGKNTGMIFLYIVNNQSLYYSIGFNFSKYIYR